MAYKDWANALNSLGITNEEEATIAAAESGADREADFDLERYLEQEYEKALPVLEVGDVVQATHGHQLRSGAEWYSAAVVALVEPLVLISAAGDMRWSCFPVEHLVKVGRCGPDVLKVVLRRLHGDQDRGQIPKPAWATKETG